MTSYIIIITVILIAFGSIAVHTIGEVKKQDIDFLGALSAGCRPC